MSSNQHFDALGGKIPNIEWLESKIGPGEEINARNRIESVSRVAIRNIKPAQLDVNDPDQKKLVENLNQTEAKIWNYSDNQPAFLARLNKNNPSVQRKAIEFIVQGGSIDENNPYHATVLRTSTNKPNTQCHSSQSPRDYQACRKYKNKILYHRTPAAMISIQRSDDSSSETSRSGPSTIDTGTISNQTEMKMVIKKTIELVGDMNKSVELVFHAIRATTRFLTYPTPSIPSDNYIFGHVKGWIWLIFKGLTNFSASKCETPQLKEHLSKLREEMNKLLHQASDLGDTFEVFNKELRSLHESVKKEAKFLKSQSTMWSLRVEGYFKYAEELKNRHDLLLNIKEDRPFSSDWVFHPHPSKAEFRSNFFHFQWVKTKKDWEVVEFEVRSDYSTCWHPYSSFDPELQIEIVLRLIEHLSAILEEATNFVKINMRLTFDFDEIKCLRFAVAEINSVKRNQHQAQYIGDLTKKLFEDMALVEEISQEFMDQLDSIVNTLEPCYSSVKKRVHPKIDQIAPLDHQSDKRKYSCCTCLSKSNQDFLQMYGEPMQAVFLRTPISEETVARFFPQENLVLEEEESQDFDITSVSYNINQYGVSEGYISSLFDREIGRDPPTKMPKRLPKVKRKSASNHTFSLRVLVDLSSKVIRRKDGELDTETFLQIIQEIRKFFQAFGSMFNFILSELTERLENLENRLYTQLSDYYESIEKMVQHEKNIGIIENDPLICGTRALQRLNIVFLFFILFVDNLSGLQEHEATAYACKSAYYKSYAKYHSWFVQKTSMFSIYSIPNKRSLYAKAMPDIAVVAEVDLLLKEFVERAVQIYDHCENVFKEKEIHEL